MSYCRFFVISVYNLLHFKTSTLAKAKTCKAKAKALTNKARPSQGLTSYKSRDVKKTNSYSDCWLPIVNYR